MGFKRKSSHIHFSVSTSTQNSSSLFVLPSTQACAHDINTASTSTVTFVRVRLGVDKLQENNGNIEGPDRNAGRRQNINTDQFL